MDTGVFAKQLSSVLEDFKQLKGKSQYGDLSDLPKDDRQALISRAIAAIHRTTGRNSSYSQEVERLLQSIPRLNEHTTSIMGVAKALLDDLNAGHLRSLVELVHADVFADFLEMAQHLCETGYKDAAAVVGGSTLESHLRALCKKAAIPIETAKPNGDIVPKKADAMNADLSSAGVYSNLDQKSVTAWLDLRNKAAHGHFNQYTQEQVMAVITGIRDFMVRNPA